MFYVLVYCRYLSIIAIFIKYILFYQWNPESHYKGKIHLLISQTIVNVIATN